MKLSRLLLPLALCATAGLARADYIVEPAQEKMIFAGMTEEQVLAVLGKPDKNLRLPGGTVTWTYNTRELVEKVYFDVDFDVAKRVRTFGRRFDAGY